MIGDSIMGSDETSGGGNVFADLGFPPEEAQNLLLRSSVMSAIKEWYDDSKLTQVAAAKKLAITQPRLNALLKGRIVEFSLDALVGIAAAAGMELVLEIKSTPRVRKVRQASLPVVRPVTKRPKKVA